ncbi:MAG: alpha-mannosidase [Saccharofermentanales bacterium]
MNTFDKLGFLEKNVKGYWYERILAEIICAVKVSDSRKGKFKGVIEKTIDYLEDYYKNNDAVTKEAAMTAETMLSPVTKDARKYTVHCISHAHIDMNWLWGFSETASITIDTFRTMLDLMKEYPQFTFSQSQASTYKIVEEYDPELLEEIKTRVKEGRWEIAASTWVEADKNLPNGESFARHVLYTKRYINRIFGVDMDDLNLDFEPDTFGHNWSIPEIMNKSGVKYYYHHRAYDGHYVFRWKSRSDAEVIVYRDPKGYGATVTYDHIPYMVQFCNDAGIKDALYNYGVGDHGGGPTRNDIEKLTDMMTWPIFPVIKFSTYGEFYAELEKSRATLPIVNQELNFVFTGCYTSQSRIKMSNRISEDRLYESEAICAAATAFTGAKNCRESFENAWEKTLFNQFHDILPGSGIIDTREYSLGEFQKVMATANTNVKNAMKKIADMIDTSDIIVDSSKNTISEGAGVGFGLEYPKNFHFPQTERGRGKTRILHMFNPTEFDKDGLVDAIIWDWNFDVARMSIKDARGKKVDFEISDRNIGVFGMNSWYWGHSAVALVIDAHVEAFGYATYIITEESATDAKKYDYLKNTAQTFNDFDKVMENDKIKAVFKAGDMRLVSLVDKDSGLEMVDAKNPACGFRLIYEDVLPRMYGSSMSAWVVGRYTKITDLNNDCKVVVYYEKKDGLRQTLKYRLSFERSSLDVGISLDKGSKLLDFAISADWHETGSESFIPQLNFAVPFNHAASKYRYDIPFATIDRDPINDDTPGNSFIMSLPDDSGKKPLMLVTDSKYGFRGVDNSIAVDLIRSSNNPDPYPEDGIHVIRLGVGIIASDDSKDAFKEASIFIHPISTISGTAHEGSLPKNASMMSIEGDVKCSAFKTAEDGDGLIVRVYDANGKGGKITVRFAKAVKSAKLTDLTETKDLGAVKISGEKISFKLGAYEIATVAVELKK